MKVQAAENGCTNGNGKGQSHFQFHYKDSIFEIEPEELRDWMVVVPEGTRPNEPLPLKRDPKTGKYSIAGVHAAAPAANLQFSELAQAEAKAVAAAIKAKSGKLPVIS